MKRGNFGYRVAFTIAVSALLTMLFCLGRIKVSAPAGEKERVVSTDTSEEASVLRVIPKNEKDSSFCFDASSGTLTFDGTGRIGQGGDSVLESDCVYLKRGGVWHWQESVKASQVKKIVVGDGVSRIWRAAFAGMENLESVEVGDGVTEIGEYAFAGCPKLKNVKIGDGVQTLPHHIFGQDGALETVSLGKSVREVGDYAFMDCLSLKNITVHKENTYLKIHKKGLYRADGKKLYAYPVGSGGNPVIMEGTETVSPMVFAYSRMTEIYIPASLTALSAGMFNGCTNLRQLVFADSSQCTRTEEVVRVWEEHTEEKNVVITCGAFKNCAALEEVCFGERFQELAETTFIGCTALRSVSIGGAVKKAAQLMIAGKPEEEEYGEKSASSKKASCNFDALTGTLTFSGDGVADGSSAEAVLPSELIMLEQEEKADTYVPAVCMWDFNKIKHIVIEERVSRIANRAFNGMEDLESLVIADEVSKAGKKSFAKCPKLKMVQIGDGLKAIPERMFCGSKLLEEVSLGSSVKEIGEAAFLNCLSLKSIAVDAANPYLQIYEKGVYSKDGKWLYAHPEGDSTEVVIAEETKGANPYVFANHQMSDIRIPASLTALSGGMFKDCKNLSRVVFEKGSHCKKTEEIWEWFPDYGDYYAYGSFMNCSSLTEIHFGDAFCWMAGATFFGCNSLKTVSFGKDFRGIEHYGYSSEQRRKREATVFLAKTNIPHGSYDTCFPALAEITVSGQNPYFQTKDNVLYTKDGKKLCYYPACRPGTKFQAPDSVRIVEKGAFCGNQNLKSLRFSENVTEIGDDAFEECAKLRRVILGDQLKLNS